MVCLYRGSFGGYITEATIGATIGGKTINDKSHGGKLKEGKKMMELFGLTMFTFFIDIYERVGMV
jgi:hypothetical protein